MAKDDGIDYDQSFDRFINREALDDVEHFTAQEVGDRCRTRLPEDKARALWKKTQIKYAKRKAEGSLPDRNQLAIENTSPSAGKWQGPDGNWYKCPADFYRERMSK